MMRRAAVRSSTAVTPSKEALRRRLFDTPDKRENRRAQIQSWLSSKETLLVAFTLAVAMFVFVHTTYPGDKVNGYRVVEDTSLRKFDRSVGNHTQAALHRHTPIQLSPLRPIDWEQYTVRINTWRRPEQLLVSVQHHAKCPGVAQLQVVWCDKENEPPPELDQYENVIVERHEENSLNERFNVLSPTPTAGILSIDDDVLRPCEAIDAGFFKWTKSPDRMVGFDGRLHVEKETGTWQYGYRSTTEKANRYSLALTRYCFLHRDYLTMYMTELPKVMLDRIADVFNCEDLAMTLLISSHTGGKPPLLADTWAIKSMIKLYVEKKISGTNNHKKLRDECMDSFSHLLGVKEGGKRLKTAKFFHSKNSALDCGDDPGHVIERHPHSDRLVELDKKRRHWKETGYSSLQKDMQRMVSVAGSAAYNLGLLEKSDKWKQRFKEHHEDNTTA